MTVCTYNKSCGSSVSTGTRPTSRKLESHDLALADVEDLFEAGNPFIFRHPLDRRRHIALGFVPDGRFVLVVFEHDEQTRWIRVVTSYEPTNPGWWKRYARAKDIDE